MLVEVKNAYIYINLHYDLYGNILFRIIVISHCKDNFPPDIIRSHDINCVFPQRRLPLLQNTYLSLKIFKLQINT